MTRDDSQSCLAFSEEHCCHSSLLSHALLGTIQSELSTTLKLSPRPSFTRIQLHVYILELLHSHSIKQQLRLDSKRNVSKYITNIAYSHRASNDIRTTELLLNTIIMLPHIVYKLYVAVLFIYTKKTQALPTRTTRADCLDEREILSPQELNSQSA